MRIYWLRSFEGGCSAADAELFAVQEKEAERRKALPSVENKTLRVRGDLTVTGPGSIKGSRTSAAFRLWLEIENLTEQEVTLVKPTLAAADSRFVVTRWYLEKDEKSLPWDGVLKPKEKKAVYAIGVEEGSAIEDGNAVAAVVEIEGLKLTVHTTAQPGLHARCPCGCDRSDEMMAEVGRLESAEALMAIAKALASIAEREQLGYVTNQMLSHRIRLLDLLEEIQGRCK